MASEHLAFTWQGDIGVIDALLERKKNAQEGKQHNADGRTLGILFNGGAQRGVLMGGIAAALEDAGLTNVFDHVVGYSAGALYVWYFCAGEFYKGGLACYREAVRAPYIHRLHPWKILDLGIIDHIVRNEEPISIEHLRAFPGKIHIGLTDAQTGDGIFIDPRTFTDPLAPIIASCAIPFLDGKLSVRIGGKRYVDGGVSWPLPARYCIETLHCTDLLILMTSSLQPARETSIDKIGNSLIPFFYSRKFAQVFRDRLQRYNENIAYLADCSHSPARICTVYPKHSSLSLFSKNKIELEGAKHVSQEFMQNFLASRKR